jgi:hypothetical protein
MRNSTISPNVRTYNTILAMFAQIGTSESAKVAEDQILMLQQFYPKQIADVFSFNHFYEAWVKSIKSSNMKSMLQNCKIR